MLVLGMNGCLSNGALQDTFINVCDLFMACHLWIIYGSKDLEMVAATLLRPITKHARLSLLFIEHLQTWFHKTDDDFLKFLSKLMNRYSDLEIILS